MGIGSRRASTSAATAALLFCFATAGTAAAEEVPADDMAVSADQTTEINNRQGWEDETDQPIQERETRRCDGPQTWYEFSSKKGDLCAFVVERDLLQGWTGRHHDGVRDEERHHYGRSLGQR